MGGWREVNGGGGVKRGYVIFLAACGGAVCRTILPVSECRVPSPKNPATQNSIILIDQQWWDEGACRAFKVLVVEWDVTGFGYQSGILQAEGAKPRACKPRVNAVLMIGMAAEQKTQAITGSKLFKTPVEGVATWEEARRESVQHELKKIPALHEAYRAHSCSRRRADHEVSSHSPVGVSILRREEEESMSNFDKKVAEPLLWCVGESAAERKPEDRLLRCDAVPPMY